jgi:glycosyltransferase involved in cell wall biosynthesis
MRSRAPTIPCNPPRKPRHLVGVFPIHNSGGWIAHTCLSLCEHIGAPDLSVELHVPASDPPGRRPFTRDAVPRWLKGLVYRLDSDGTIVRGMLRRHFRRALPGADVAYLWAAVHEDFYADVRAAGVPLCVERINCHRETSRPILDEAYRRAGLAPAHAITDAHIAEERRKLAMADWIFAPSPMVHRSLLGAGVPAEKILATSYGWSPERMAARRRSRPADAPIRVLYVGSVIIRKGAHLLLDAWAGAGINGRLEFYGRVLPEVEQVAGSHLARANVVTRGHVADIAQAYADSDIFALPTLEEGSPLVIYEAMAHGLAILTTPMGSGGVVRDGIEGLVRDPYDRDAWITELRRLTLDPELRVRLGTAARARAQEFTWPKVGARRREMLLAALASRQPAAG